MESNPVAIAIREVLSAIRQRKRVDEILEMVLTYSSDLARAAYGSIVTVDQKARKLVITSTRGANWTLEKQMHRLSLGEGLTGHVALTGKPYLCNDTRVDPNYFAIFEDVRSELVVPIVVEERVWGLINLDGLWPDSFDEFTLSNVMLMAELASFAIKSRIDLTEQDRLQRHLIQSEKLASLGETIAGIAHEINNPMTSILSHAQLLTLHRGGPADEASIGVIVQEAKRTAELVKNLLAFSRKESKQHEVVNAHELIRQAVNLKRYHFRVNNVQLVVEPTNELLPVSVSAQQMQQVLLNLLNNAEQAISKNGGHPGIIRCEAVRKGERVVMTVTDNGSGIPAHVLPNIFDPFFTTKKLGEGTGLGLSIAHTLIESHGGSIYARSSPGHTVFTIDLPLADEAELSIDTRQTQPLPRPPARQDKKQGRILVVDDETPIVDAVADFLDLQNIEVDKANDGNEAIELLRKNRYDAIVSDIRMPGMGGEELFDHAVGIDPDYRNRFLFMSGDLVRDSTQNFVSTVDCPCLHKPFPLQLLFQHLQPLLNRDAKVHGITQAVPVLRATGRL